jgi:acyl-CoA synthetase (NDP forming)
VAVFLTFDSHFFNSSSIWLLDTYPKTRPTTHKAHRETGALFSKESGPVALTAQSGQLSECITARAQGEGIRYSKSVSYGNAADINRYFKIARNNSGKNPLIIWKVGLTRMSATASASHTGSLAGTGAAKVSTLDELTDTTVAFSCLPKGCGSRVAYISGGRAGTVIGGDALLHLKGRKNETLPMNLFCPFRVLS